MRVRLGADHGGFGLKEAIERHLRVLGHDVEDVGAHDDSSVDYPPIAEEVARSVAGGEADLGILVCGTGIGMAITANKVPGVRAANVTSVQFATLARAHNDANVLALSGRFTDEDTALAIVDAFLSTPFGGERHARRVGQISEVDRRRTSAAARTAE